MTTFKHPDINAMAKFAEAIKDSPHNAQRAAIFWLADYFLGLKLWHLRTEPQTHESAKSIDAVDPSASDPGKLSTRA